VWIQPFRHHPKNKGKARKADRKVRTIAGRLVRELQRHLGESSVYQRFFDLFARVLAQKRNSKSKVYSLHEPDVVCISKGKEHKKFEFGNKVSVVITRNTGVLLGALGFRSEFDGHTLQPALEQVEKPTGKAPKTAAVDRGYRGNIKIGETSILIPVIINLR